jgi:hypothetical protein
MSPKRNRMNRFENEQENSIIIETKVMTVRLIECERRIFFLFLLFLLQTIENKTLEEAEYNSYTNINYSKYFKDLDMINQIKSFVFFKYRFSFLLIKIFSFLTAIYYYD